jgi:Zn-dependent peptidase ImmA (M78 family)
VWEAITGTLGFPLRFFEGDSLISLREENANFRSLRRTTAAQRNQVLAAGSIAMELNAFIEARFDLPPVDLPDLSDYVDAPEAAAAALRSLWELGDKRIPNTIALLEVHGVRVFSLVEDLREVNAFSVWIGERPFVFLNTTKSAEASRFDAMHELAHLVLHHRDGDLRKAEAEAHKFAAAMLMPAADVLACTPRSITLPGLIKLKRRWGVSVSALAHRLSDLGVMGPWPYRNMCIEISTRGYRTSEPEPMERESSRVLAKVFAALRAEGMSVGDIADELAIPKREINSLIFGLAILGLDGGGQPAAATERKSKTSLRAVKIDDERR